MKKARILTAMISGMLMTHYVQAQGGLTPPGTPGETMKTLNQIYGEVLLAELAAEEAEPRRLISNAGYVITQSGSYVLTANLTATAGQNGITVNANDVSIDLNGFTLTGSGTDSGFGIYQGNSYRNLTVSNGKAVNWRGGSRYGIDATGTGTILSGIQVSANSNGIYTGDGGTVQDCTARSNTPGIGIFTEDGCTVQRCTASGNSSDGGILVGTGSTVQDCASVSNTGRGYTVSSGSTVQNCSAYGNTGEGIYALYGLTIINCAVSYNTGDGIYAAAGCTIQSCAAQFNTGDGIQISDDSQVRDCTCNSNGYLTGDGAGIHVTGGDNRLDGNNVTDNDRGFDVDAAGNFIVRNSASGNTANYDITGTQTIGPIITATGTISSTSPWANFGF
jgi:parallel beta-helix repeat protein